MTKSVRTYLVGDIIVYPLATSEALKETYLSGVAKYAAVNLFPHRVVRVMPHNLKVKPIYGQKVLRALYQLLSAAS